MLTGKRAFEGKTQASLIAAILSAEPPSITRIQPLTPPLLEHVIQRCVVKDPDSRWQTAGDLKSELKWIENTPISPAIPAQRQRGTRLPWLIVGLLLVISAALTTLIVFHRERELGTIRFLLLPPPDSTFGHNIVGRGTGAPAPHFVVSPDGRRLAYVIVTGAGRPQLWVRGMDVVSGQPLPGTEDASFPFWSPDSRFVAFFAQGKLKRIDASGGALQTVCEAPAGEGGTWNRTGEIVLAPDNTGGLYRVAASGGVVSPVTTLDRTLTERSHRWPQFLPDGRHFLYLAVTDRQEGAVYVGSLDSTSAPQLVLKPALRTVYAPSGHLLFLRESTLMAQPFDTQAFRLTGEPVPLAEDVAYNAVFGRTAFSVSDNGVLAYRTSGTGDAGSGLVSQLWWFDRAGKRLDSFTPVANYSGGLRLSPDETRLVVQRVDRLGGFGDLWVFDLARSAIPSRFTFSPDRVNVMPVWSPDGRSIAFASGMGAEETDLYEKATAGTENARVLLKSSRKTIPVDWSPDGRLLMYRQADPKTKNDLWLLPVTGAGQPTAFLQTPFNEQDARFSPDGKWIAYVSDQGGSFDVYVRPFPAGDREWRISVGGGEEPQWRRDGKELFYMAPGRKLMAVDIETGSSFAAGVPKMLFETRMRATSSHGEHYAVAGNGQRFLIDEVAGTAAPITVVLNWTAALKR
jgi:Tol biopolymer transport system component